MRAVILAENDWANVGYYFTEAFKAVDIQAVGFARRSNGFEYENSLPLVSKKTMAKYVETTDIVLYCHTIPLGVYWERGNKKLGVFHGGSRYRNEPDKWNEFWNSKVDVTLLQTPEFFKHDPKNPYWIYPGIDTDFIRLSKKVDPFEVRFVGHFPNDHKAQGKNVGKGTDEVILPTLESLKDNVGLKHWESVVSRGHVRWRRNIDRISGCDVIIETITERGGWGMTALEAAALSKVVITNFKWKSDYEKEFGCKWPLYRANNASELRKQLTKVLRWSNSYLEEKQEEAREWVVKNHGLKPTGERLLKAFGL